MFSRYWWVLLTGFVVGPVAGILIAAVITYMMPKLYESYATLEVKIPQADLSMSSVVPTRHPIASEAQIITSQTILQRTVDSLNLTSIWAVTKETAIHTLKSKLRVDMIHGTDLLRVSARSANREEARDLVAAVVAAYSEHRGRTLPEPLQFDSLRKAFREQEDKVEDKRKKLALIEKQGDTLDVGRLDHVDAERNFETELALLDELRIKLISEGLITYIPTNTVVVHDDPVIAHSPISPNVTLNLVLGGAGGLLLSPFFTLPVMWLLGRRKRIV